MTDSSFLTDVKTLRARARQNVDKGPVTDSYGADLPRVLAVLNDVLATELVCVLRYKRHYYTAKGLNAAPVAAEFLEHANQEQEHADWVAKRITELGGSPDFDPQSLASRSHSEYDASDDLLTMVKEDLVAERIAIASYQEILRWLADGDPTTGRLIKDILAVEEEHADDLLNILENQSG